MIEINLLPENLRKKQPIKLKIPSELIKNSLISVVAILVLIHIVIQMLIIINSVVLGQLNKSWLDIQPKKKQIDDLKTEIKKFKSFEDTFVRLGAQRVLVSPKLNLISDAVISGVWLSELSISDVLEIKGSSISASAGEMALIGRFLNTLKSDSKINKDFPTLELVSVQRRKMGPTEVVDFVISSKVIKELKK